MIIHNIIVFLSLYLIQVDGGYTITTPRRWTFDQPSQLCVTLTEPSTGKDYFNAIFKTTVKPWERNKETLVLQEKKFAISAGKQSICYEYVLPKTSKTNIGIFIEGSILGKNVSHSHDISVATANQNVFVQTDKYLYKPEQNVQFRILTLNGPLLQVSFINYTDIWVENPSASRIHQWKDVRNAAGLIHLSFQLSEEPDQGEYKVNVQLSDGEIYSTTFKVEDYVLPRYDISVTPPNYILGTAKNATFDVCARYTFGQPVKGKLILDVNNGGWGSYKETLNKTKDISGCTKVVVSIDDLKINRAIYTAYSINAKATVIENGTDVELASDLVSAPISRTVLTFTDAGHQKFKKPGMPFVDEVLVEFPDGSQASNEPLTLCIKDICKNMSTNTNGILKYAISPNTEDDIIIKSPVYTDVGIDNHWRSIMHESRTRRSQKTYFSPSNSSLIIALEEKSLKCDITNTIDMDLLVRYASSGQGNTLVHLQIVSRGLIQYFNSSTQDLSISNDIHIPEDIFITPMNKSNTDLVRGSFNIPISLPKSVSPKLEILIWYERADGEVVSDHRSVDVAKCLPNNVKLQWSQDLARPGDEANLTIDSEPMSLCSLGVVDKSVELLSSGHKTLTTNKLLEIANGFTVDPHEVSQVDDSEYCSKKNAEKEDTIENKPNMPGIMLPQMQRSFFGYRPRSSSEVDAISMFSGAGVFVFSDLTLETRPCNDFSDHIAYSLVPVVDSPVVPGIVLDQSVIQSDKTVRAYFPETWLWEFVELETGMQNISLALPDTVTEWVGRAVCVHPTKGIGLSNAASVTTFKDFFIDLTLPPTAKRGEIFPVKISLFNYLKNKLPVNLALLESPDYDILTEKSEELGTGTRVVCVEPEGSTVFTVRIKPKLAGQMNITVEAMIDINSVQCGGANIEERSDIVVKPVQVDYEGFPKEKTWNNYVCVKETVENPPDIWKMVAPAGIVEDSARGWLSVVSDLMGPTIENLGHLIKMPYGCGEQNMLNFAPNIFILQYLEAANETTESVGEKSIRFMDKGYQRELTYRHSDGSFSAFGSSDASGSTWLTAFVLKSFHKAQQFINIDRADIKMSADWLKSKQMENGCFELVGKVLHKDMKGGIGDSGSPSLLSTYVLLSLLEAGEDPTSAVVREAQFCLNADNTNDPYALALRLYAFTLAESPEADQTATALLAQATQADGTLSWDIHNDEKKGKSTAVELASYAVLGLLHLDSAKYEDSIHGIVRWINQQRNSQGGFISTQDTILALQALSLYEIILPAGEPDATVLFSSTNHDASFSVNSGNKLLLQKSRLPSIPATVTVDVIGSGCVLLQGVLRYNVIEGDQNKAFNLSVTTDTPYDTSCKSKEITVCASYLLPDLVSNMAIIEVNLVSGYIPSKEGLKRVVGYGTGLFKRYEVDGSTVMFYLDEIPTEGVCAEFKIIREVDVENVKPGTVKVYDYYKPENVVSQSYVLPADSECTTTIPELPFEREILIDNIPGLALPPSP